MICADKRVLGKKRAVQIASAALVMPKQLPFGQIGMQKIQ